MVPVIRNVPRTDSHDLTATYKANLFIFEGSFMQIGWPTDALKP